MTLDHRGSGVTEEQVSRWEGRGRAQPLEAGAQVTTQYSGYLMDQFICQFDSESALILAFDPGSLTLFCLKVQKFSILHVTSGEHEGQKIHNVHFF